MGNRHTKPFIAALLLLLTLLGALPVTWSQAQTATPELSRYFKETQHYVKGRFLLYWMSHGALEQQGYPLTEEINEQSDVNGKIYTVQYFERAVFEYHPENPAPNDVLLSLLGSLLYKQKYPAGAPSQAPNTLAGSVLFSQTGKRSGGSFLQYWQQHGGLAQQGYPISDEFLEKSALDGKIYKVQYFERAVFEEHPENQAPNNVLLSQVGKFRLQGKYADTSVLPKAAPPQPDGIGLTKDAWEAIHGSQDPWDPNMPGMGIDFLPYQSHRFSIYYTQNTRIYQLTRRFEQGERLDYARVESQALLPLDARMVRESRSVDMLEGSAAVVTTYRSNILASTLAGAVPPYGTSPDDVWYGAAPGTFYVEYQQLDAQVDSVYQYFIAAGDPGSPAPDAAAPNYHGPGGLGLPRSTWEKAYSQGDSQPNGKTIEYAGGRFLADFTSRNLISELTAYLRNQPLGEAAGIAFARKVSKRLVPSDAQLLIQKKLHSSEINGNADNFIYYADTYFSSSLKTTYKQGTVSWHGASPGTFHIVFEGNQYPLPQVYKMTIRLGNIRPIQ